MTNNSNSLTKEELAEHFNLNISWINQHLDEIPHFKIHRLVRFNLDEVQLWLKKFKKGEVVKNDSFCIPRELTLDITSKISSLGSDERLEQFKKMLRALKCGRPFPEGCFIEDAYAEYETVCFFFGRNPKKSEMQQAIEDIEKVLEESKNEKK